MVGGRRGVGRQVKWWEGGGEEFGSGRGGKEGVIVKWVKRKMREGGE